MWLVFRTVRIGLESIVESIGATIGTDYHQGPFVKPDQGASIEGLVQEDQFDVLLRVKATLVKESVVANLNF